MQGQKFILKTGAESLVYAPIVEDSAENYTTGEVKHLIYAAELSKSTPVEKEQIYYDNIAMKSNTTEGETEITISASVLPLDLKAELSGKSINAATGAVMDDGVGRTVYFAFGYKTKFDDGTFKCTWHLKGSFATSDEDYATEEGADTEETGQEIVFTGLQTIHKFDYADNVSPAVRPGKTIEVEERGGKTDVTKFFDAVVTPETIGSLAISGDG